MKILHTFDCAAVACTLAKFQNLQGHDAHVISFKRMDPFGFLKHYGFECLDTDDPNEFYLNAIDRATDYDVIHVHFVWGILPYLRNRYGDTKRIIMHYHGSDIRQFHTDRNFRKCIKLADYVIGSTKELEQYSDKLHHIPNPIDTDHFHYINNHSRGGTLCITRKEDNELVREHIKKHKLNNVEIINRANKPLSYAKMPELLSNYTDYADIKFQDGKILPTDSKTGYEALACGLNRIDNDGNSTKGLPSSMEPNNQVKQYEQIYQS